MDDQNNSNSNAQNQYRSPDPLMAPPPSVSPEPLPISADTSTMTDMPAPGPVAENVPPITTTTTVTPETVTTTTQPMASTMESTEALPKTEQPMMGTATTTTVTPETVTTTTAPVAAGADSQWPSAKPKSKMPQILGGVIAIFLVLGVATAAYFVSNRISGRQAVAPTAPESEPQAALKNSNTLATATPKNPFGGATAGAGMTTKTPTKTSNSVGTQVGATTPKTTTNPFGGATAGAGMNAATTPMPGSNCYCVAGYYVGTNCSGLGGTRCGSATIPTGTANTCTKKSCPSGTTPSCYGTQATCIPSDPNVMFCANQHPCEPGWSCTGEPFAIPGSTFEGRICVNGSGATGTSSTASTGTGGGGGGGGGGGTTPGATCPVSAPTELNVVKLSPTSVRLRWTAGTGQYVKLWVSKNSNPTAYCGTLAPGQTNNNCVANEGRDNGLPATPSNYLLTGLQPDTKYYWRMMMWAYSGCDQEAPIITFTTDPGIQATPGACMEVKMYAKKADGTYDMTTPMTTAQLAAVKIGDKVRLAIRSSKINLKARFRVSIDNVVENTGDTTSPEWRAAQGYAPGPAGGPDFNKVSWYSDYEIKKSGVYKFEAQVSTAPILLVTN